MMMHLVQACCPLTPPMKFTKKPMRYLNLKCASIATILTYIIYCYPACLESHHLKLNSRVVLFLMGFHPVFIEILFPIFGEQIVNFVEISKQALLESMPETNCNPQYLKIDHICAYRNFF